MPCIHCEGAKRTHSAPDMQLFKDSKIAERVQGGHILQKKKKKKRLAFLLNVESVDMTLDMLISA